MIITYDGKYICRNLRHLRSCTDVTPTPNALQVDQTKKVKRGTDEFYITLQRYLVIADHYITRMAAITYNYTCTTQAKACDSSTAICASLLFSHDMIGMPQNQPPYDTVQIGSRCKAQTKPTRG